VATRLRDWTLDKATSFSEYQQRDAQGGDETDQQFHLDLLDEELRAIAGW
jgi:hypothetical protein